MAKDKAVKRPDDHGRTVKMRFPKDMYYTDQNVPIYKGGEVVEVPESMVTRWLKRGGVLISDEKAGRAPIQKPVEPPPSADTKVDEEKGEDEKK